MHDDEMASDPTEFWHRRRGLTPATEPGIDDVGGYRLVLLAEITDPDVLAACERITAALDRFACFDPSPTSVHHLTIKMFDAVVEPTTTDLEAAAPSVRRVDSVVSDVTTACDPFEIELTQFNLFPDIVYGEVADDGRLAELNRRICDHAGITTLDRDGDEFIPHLTFGYFCGDSDYDALLEYIETNRALAVPPIRVTDVTLTAYEVGGRPPMYNQLEQYEL